MYQVRSITPTRVAVTTHHTTHFLATYELKSLIERGDHNAMIVQECKHNERHVMSYPDARGDCLCFCCDTCGMVTNFKLPAEVAADMYAKLAVEVTG